MKSQGENVTFLLDGYDELPSEYRQESLVANIIRREILLLSAVVISSRPHASVDLRINATCHVDILGFTKTDQQYFFKTSLKDESTKLEKLTNYLQAHPNISNLCFTPFHATILVWFCKRGFPLPDSSTSLYERFVYYTILHHLAREKGNNATKKFSDENHDLDTIPEPYHGVLIKLSKLCRKALKKNDLVFSLEDIKKACPKIEDPELIDAFGLLQVVEHYSDDQVYTKTFNFIHFSVQEFLAAYHLTRLNRSKELKCLKKYFFHENFGNTFSMYMGLTGGKSSAFKTFLASYGQGAITRFKNRIMLQDKTKPIASIFFEDDRKSLKLYQCFHEANEEQSYRNITEKLHTAKQIDLQKDSASATPLLTGDLICLTFFLSKSPVKAWLKLNVPSCYIRDDGLRTLHRCLTTNKITVEVINLECNLLSPQSEYEVADIVCSCQTRRLIVRDNKLEDGLDLSKCSTLLTLDISSNKLSSNGAGRLFYTLSNNKSRHLRVLKINNNPLSEEAVDKLANYLQHDMMLEELYAVRNKLSTDNAIKIFSNLTVAKNTNLKILDLSENFIKDEAVSEIIACLEVDFLQTLYLQGNDITTPSIEKIVDSIADNQHLAKLGVPDNINDSRQIYMKQDGINKKRNYKPKLHISIL